MGETEEKREGRGKEGVNSGAESLCAREISRAYCSLSAPIFPVRVRTCPATRSLSSVLVALGRGHLALSESVVRGFFVVVGVGSGSLFVVVVRFSLFFPPP